MNYSENIKKIKMYFSQLKRKIEVVYLYPEDYKKLNEEYLLFMEENKEKMQLKFLTSNNKIKYVYGVKIEENKEDDKLNYWNLLKLIGVENEN